MLNESFSLIARWPGFSYFTQHLALSFPGEDVLSNSVIRNTLKANFHRKWRRKRYRASPLKCDHVSAAIDFHFFDLIPTKLCTSEATTLARGNGINEQSH